MPSQPRDAEAHAHYGVALREPSCPGGQLVCRAYSAEEAQSRAARLNRLGQPGAVYYPVGPLAQGQFREE